MNTVEPEDGVFCVEIESDDGWRARMRLDEESVLRLAVALCDVCVDKKPRKLDKSIEIGFEKNLVSISAGLETVLLCPGCAAGLASAIVRACDTRERATATCHLLN